MLNQVTLQGRLTRDPELRYLPNGTAVASFSLAVERDFADKATGERKADFIDITAWRSTAEFVSKWFSKGQLTIVTGRLQIRDWQDKEGNKRRSAEVVAENVYFGESKKSRESSGDYSQSGPPSGGYDSAAPSPSSAFSEIDDGDGELPF